MITVREFENYHIHNHESNIFYLDSPVSIEDYANRAKELGHQILSTCNHGFQGNFLNTWLVAQKHNLKFVFAVEAYWVKDRLALVDGNQRDKTNAHIVLIAKDEIGRRQITAALSEANDTGYYYRPRLDLSLLTSLDPAHVMVTTACVAFWGYGLRETENIVLKLWRKFGDSFYLEVQAHKMEEQKRINSFILSLSRKYGMKVITACDSHYIYPEQDEERKNLQNSTRIGAGEDLESMGMDEAENSDVLYMDYPDGDELYRRFIEQGVLPPNVIEEAMRNTLIIRTFEDFTFDKSKKVPNPYKHLTKEERNAMYLDLVHRKWEEYKHSVPKEKWPIYEAEIKYETDTIVDTDFADYFLLDYEVVQRGKAKGGIITESGRGSAASYFTNSLLGFSSMDRLALPVKLFPDRFVSKPRLLAGKLPDLDLNVADRTPFVEAQKELLGEDHAYPMIAYGTLKRKAAWKMYARAMDLDPELANKISERLGRYDLDVKHAEDPDDIDIADYVDAKYLPLVEESAAYTGIISGKTMHPCAVLIYDGDIRSEIGLVRAKSDTAGKVDELVTVIDGATAEKFGYIKNDFLRVAVWELITQVYNDIGIKVPDAMSLMKMTENDKGTWEIFANGHTIGVNQCEREKTRLKCMRYKPKNLTELSAFVAAVRPSFQSNVEIFLNRQPFSYGIREFDALIQTEQMRSSFLLYQENIMAALEFAGFNKTECYTQLQNIAKKHPEEIEKIKPRFLDGFAAKIGGDQEKARDTAERVWQIISDASGYGFCCAHAAAVAFDALYIAYAKSKYPLQTYRAMLEVYSKRGDKERLAAIKTEMMNAFGIRLDPVQFGSDNTKFTVDRAENAIQDALHSIPYMNRRVAQELASLRPEDFPTWVDLLVHITENTSLNARQIEILIKLDYFKRYGDVHKLLDVFSAFREGPSRYAKTYKGATKEKRLALLREMEANWNGKQSTPYELARYQVEITGSVLGKFDVPPNRYVILDVDARYSAKLTLYNLSRGTSGTIKMKKPMFHAIGAKVGDTIHIVQWCNRPRYGFEDGKPKPIPGTNEKWILDAYVVESNDVAELAAI